MYQSLISFLSSLFNTTVTTATAAVTDTTVSANNVTYTAPANITDQLIIDSGNGDTVVANAAILVVVDTGSHDSTTTSSHNVTFVAEGASDSLTLTAAGANAIIDLTDATGGLNNATQFNATQDNASLQNTNYSPNYCSYYYCSQVPFLDVNGNANKVRLGNYSTGTVLNGTDNIVVGGCASSTVTTSANAGANVFIGGSGTMTAASAAIGMSAIGGSGSMILSLTGDFANVIAGQGRMQAVLTSNDATVETGTGVSAVTITGAAAIVVTGAGSSTICYNDTVGGGLLYQGAATDVLSQFNVNAIGATIYGGDVVNATGNNNTISSRGAATTDQGGSVLSVLQSVVYGEASALLPDADIQAALQAAGVSFLPSGVTAVVSGVTSGLLGGCCGSICGSSSAYWGYRTINVSGQNDTVNSDSRNMFVTVNGSNDSLYGGTVGQIYWIQSGGSNNYYAGAGNNFILGDCGVTNVLNYQNAPGATTVNLACNYAINGYGGVDWVYNMNNVQIGTNSTAIAGSQSAVLTAYGSGSTLQGGCGNDTLTALGNTDTLIAGAGSDTITTTGTGDSYVVGQVGAIPASTIINQQAAGVTGTLSFLACTTPSEVWLAADKAGDLVIDILGTAKSITIDNWFSAGTQLSSFAAGGKTLVNSAINSLETAMANYQSAHPSFSPQTATALPTDSGIQAAYAAWH